MSEQNTAPSSSAPHNTPYFSESMGMKVGSLEADVRHLHDTCEKLDGRIKPLEDWKSEVSGGWKTAKWLVTIAWLLGSALIPWIMKKFGLL